MTLSPDKRRELILQRVVDRANPYEGEVWKRQRVAELMGRGSSQPEKPKAKRTKTPSIYRTISKRIASELFGIRQNAKQGAELIEYR